MKSVKEMTIETVNELAHEKYDCEYYELPEETQREILISSENIVADKIANEIDNVIEAIRKGSYKI